MASLQPLHGIVFAALEEVAVGLRRLPGDERAVVHRREDNVRTIRHLATCTVLLWSFLAAAPASMACPVCHTETGKKVRAGIFSDEFASNAAMTLLPFPILISLVALIHFGPPTWMTAPKRRPNERTHR